MKFTSINCLNLWRRYVLARMFTISWGLRLHSEKSYLSAQASRSAVQTDEKGVSTYTSAGVTSFHLFSTRWTQKEFRLEAMTSEIIHTTEGIKHSGSHPMWVDSQLPSHGILEGTPTSKSAYKPRKAAQAVTCGSSHIATRLSKPRAGKEDERIPLPPSHLLFYSLGKQR